MKQQIAGIFKKIERFFLNSEVWVFAVAIFTVTLVLTNASPPYSWSEYLGYLFIFFLLFCPTLLFEYFKPQLKKRFSYWKYLLLWGAAFLLNQALVVIAWTTSSGYINIFIDTSTYEPLITMALVILYVKVALELNHFLRKKLPGLGWIKKIGLEKAILGVIFLFSVILSLMAVSSIGVPEYDQKDHLLIGTLLDISKIIDHFGTFLAFTIQFTIFYLAGYFFYFVNHYFLIPRLLKEKGILIYAIGVTGTVVVFYPVFGQLLTMLPLNERLGGTFTEVPFDSDNALGAFAIMVFSLPVILAIQWFKQNSELSTLAREKVQTELDLLKQQINPHFFFNTLNNLYSLSLTKSDKTPEMIMRLSELMRYVIYKGREEKVQLHQEVQYIEDYIHLQQLRLHNPVQLTFSKDIEVETLALPPLLLIMLVENAFKHGVEPAGGTTFLHLTLHSSSNSLIFTCENSYEGAEVQEKGIGLENLRRRLELQFPKKHQLLIEKGAGLFKVQLTLNFDKA